METSNSNFSCLTAENSDQAACVYWSLVMIKRHMNIQAIWVSPLFANHGWMHKQWGLISLYYMYWERSDSVVECLTRDRGAAGSSLTGFTALCPWARHNYPSLVLVQSRKTRPCITERLLMGRKESNQTNKKDICYILCIFQDVKAVVTSTGSSWVV